MSDLDRFDYELQLGRHPMEAVQRLIGSIPDTAPDVTRKRLALASALMENHRISLAEASEAMRAIGIHPFSIVGMDLENVTPLEEMGVEKLLGLPHQAEGEACYIQPGGGFSLRGIRELESLPPGLKINFLHLASLPKLRSLGEGIEVYRSLRIEDCPDLQTLPSIRGDELSIWISGCPSFTGSQGSIHATRAYLADLDSMERLSFDTNASCSVLIRDCPSLREIRAEGGSISELSLHRSGVEELHGLRRIEGELRIEGCGELTRIEGPLRVGQSAFLRHLPRLSEFGTRIQVGGDLHLEGLPEGLQLPEDLQVGGTIRIHRPCGRIQVPRSLLGQVVFYGKGSG